MIFRISTLEFAEMQKIVQNKKTTTKKQKQTDKQTKIEFGTKMPYLGLLGVQV